LRKFFISEVCIKLVELLREYRLILFALIDTQEVLNLKNAVDPCFQRISKRRCALITLTLKVNYLVGLGLTFSSVQLHGSLYSMTKR